MTYNYCFDFSSLVFLSMLLFFYYSTPKYSSFQNRLFGYIIITNFVCVIADIISGLVLFNYLPNEIILNRLVLMIYFSTQHMLAPMYLMYVMVISYPDNLKATWKKYRFLIIPAAVDQTIIITSVFTNIAFRYDEAGYYRTNFYILSLVLAGFYLFASLIVVYKNRKRMSFLPRFSVICYTLSTIVFTLIQFYLPSVLLICSAATIAIFIMYLALQNPSLLKDALEEAETSKKAAEMANEAKSAFLANMSHEIRTPMNAICGMTYLLGSTELKDDAREYVETIKNSSESLLALINDILDISKVDSGIIEIDKNPYRLDDILRDVRNYIAPLVDYSKIATNVFVGPDVPLNLIGDVYKVRQVVTNLISNAVKFTEEGEILLKIDARKKDDKKVDITFTVKDTGIGIKDEDLDKLFVKFEQIDMAKNRKREGSGLGLAIVKSYVELLNGHIDVESEFGKGSTFKVTIEQEYVDNKTVLEENEEIKDVIFVILEKNEYSRRNLEMMFSSVDAEYVILESLSQDTLKASDKFRYCLLYNFADYNEHVVNQDLSWLPLICKIAMVRQEFEFPTELSDTVFVKKPFSYITVNDTLKKFRNHEVKQTEQKEELPKFDPKTRIAIVDDNRVNLKVTSTILKKFGIQAQTMLSGFEILESYEDGAEYDLIFMDHMMPEMDGIETVKRIRALDCENAKEVPIIALTANAVMGVEDEYMKAGMNATLFKPVNIDALKVTLVKWLHGKLII
ncbi:MAG: ATP-binding protein [Lachnospiraceae bacterium]|nr:ATP-binding protein [Lachnospiraceae bacterium]